jgi:hypothetical protein
VHARGPLLAGVLSACYQMKMTQALGITFPPEILLQVTEVIQ